MNKNNHVLFGIVLFILMFGCKSVSKFAIDQEPKIEIDTNFWGIWKAVEDTDKANFILVQSKIDLYKTFIDVYNNMDSIYKDSSTYAECIDDLEKRNANLFYISYMNRHGLNALYQQWDAFVSEIQNVKFLNISYWHHSYFYVRIIDLNPDSMTTALVADTTLQYLKSSKQLRSRIGKNLTNPKFYSDTLHFYKVNSYHESLNESIQKAN